MFSTFRPGIPCYDPANLETVEIESRCPIKVGVSKHFLQRHLDGPTHQLLSELSTGDIDGQADPMESLDFSQLQTFQQRQQLPPMREAVPVSGFVVMEDSSRIKLIHPDEMSSVVGLTLHDMSFSCLCPIYPADDCTGDYNFLMEGKVDTQPNSPPIVSSGALEISLEEEVGNSAIADEAS